MPRSFYTGNFQPLEADYLSAITLATATNEESGNVWKNAYAFRFY